MLTFRANVFAQGVIVGDIPIPKSLHNCPISNDKYVFGVVTTKMDSFSIH